MSLKVSFEYVQKDKMPGFSYYRDEVASISEMINKKSGPGGEFLGWMDYADNYDEEEIERLIKKANEFQKKYETLVVCGIGGSFLGAKAVIEALNGTMGLKNKMEILFFGNTLDPHYSNEILTYIENKKFAVCVVSKSGTTTETSVSFRILKNMMEEKFGKEYAKDAIVAVTDSKNGALRQLADSEGYDTYDLPSNIGGRFSVLTPVGLFPIACAGIDVKEFLKGFSDAKKDYASPDLLNNECYQYAVVRNHLYNLGYKAENLSSYELRFKSLNEWWKQLFDESEGKDNKAVLTTSTTFTTDLHSMGQFIQEGSKFLYETVIWISNTDVDVTVPYDKDDLDGLNYLAGKKLSYINNKAYEGTLEAHSVTGKVPNIKITMDEMNTHNLGYLLFFFMKSCAMSAYLLKVNPFNQPGVEVYKKNMFHLLGKKGY